MRMMRMTFPINIFSFAILRTDHRTKHLVLTKSILKSDTYIDTLKVAKKTDAHMRKFSNVKNQRLYRRHAHQLYAQNAPDCVGCQS